jgi:predicted transcriptional regulator
MVAPATADVTNDDEDFIDAVRKHEPATTREVAEEIGISRQGADYRLRELEDKKEVKSKKPGHDLIWTVNRDD